MFSIILIETAERTNSFRYLIQKFAAISTNFRFAIMLINSVLAADGKHNPK